MVSYTIDHQWYWLGSLLLLVALYICFSRVSRYLAYRKAKRLHGCERPPQYRHQDHFFGLDLFLRQHKVGNEESWLSTSKTLFAQHGKTYEINHLGKRLIHTSKWYFCSKSFLMDFQCWKTLRRATILFPIARSCSHILRCEAADTMDGSGSDKCAISFVR